MACTAGRWAGSGASLCTSCTPGRVSTLMRANSSAACQACRAGKWAASPASTACEACVPGQWAAPAASLCTLCVPGKASAHVGANSSGFCVRCGAGNYSARGVTLTLLTPPCNPHPHANLRGCQLQQLRPWHRLARGRLLLFRLRSREVGRGCSRELYCLPRWEVDLRVSDLEECVPAVSERDVEGPEQRVPAVRLPLLLLPPRGHPARGVLHH